MKPIQASALLVVGVLAGILRADAEPLASRVANDKLKLTSVTIAKGNSQEPSRFSFTLENQSGGPLRIGVLQKGVVLGECNTVENVAGIPYVAGDMIDHVQDKENRAKILALVPSGGSATGAVSMYQCANLARRGGELNVNITFVVADDDEVENIPLTAKALAPQP
jgi:hypothetical protein